MNESELKRKMMALWKDVFHDTDAHIGVIFDRYWDPELVEYEVSGNDIVAGLIGIPYEFGGEEEHIRGLYLYGLATKSRCRGQGIMGRLMEKINDRARKMGFAFTFVVPQSERLQRFYTHRGYVDAFYRCEQNYTSLHDFRAEYNMILEAQKEKVADLKKKYFDSLSGAEVKDNTPAETVENIRKLIAGIENGQCDLEILHSMHDVDSCMAENKVLGGKIYYTATAQGVITAVAFTTLVDRSRVDIERLFSSDQCSTYRLLDYIKLQESDAGIRVYIEPKDAEWKNLAKCHGMARILNLSEILKFQAKCHVDLKYSILVKGENEAVERYDIRNGNVKSQNLNKEDEEYDTNMTVMSLRDVSVVLFRRPDTGRLIFEAFGMPSLGGYITMIPD